MEELSLITFGQPSPCPCSGIPVWMPGHLHIVQSPEKVALGEETWRVHETERRPGGRSTQSGGKGAGVAEESVLPLRSKLVGGHVEAEVQLLLHTS